MNFSGWIVRTMAAFFVLAGVVGCADLDTVKNAPLDKGISQDFNVAYNRLTAATLTALSSLDVNLVGSSEDETGTIYLVSKAMSVSSWGEVGRIYVKKSSAAPTTVIVYWEKRATGGQGIGAKEFTHVFFETLGKLLAG